MNRALAMARTGTPFATVAAVAGYADQAHLSREVKALAGVPLSELTPPPAVTGRSRRSRKATEPDGSLPRSLTPASSRDRQEPPLAQSY
jgi:AraC-like DNA-binding protein